MVPKKTVAVATDNLVRLGAERLARILLELAGELPAIKRRLRFELAGEAGGEMIAAEMNKRIVTLRSARSFVDWQKRANFVRDLDLTRTTIVERVGQSHDGNWISRGRRATQRARGRLPQLRIRRFDQESREDREAGPIVRLHF